MVSAPFIWQQQIYNQDDFLFHKARLLAYYTAVVHEHTLVPRVLATMAGGFGYAADMFYNSLALLPFVVLKALLGGFVVPYNLYLAGISVLTALTAYWCGRRVFAPRQSFVFAALYVTNTYRLIDMYVRGALGETIASSSCRSSPWVCTKRWRKRSGACWASAWRSRSSCTRCPHSWRLSS
ncbi:hypothetical protein [Lacticaseibacillus sharpeae]|uniref:hypothetical protein n=1 Tax=Lacticaseibacillus sharpeae TaxID=1626 RepID=UPI00138F4358|nr:hypothetical protein [Lacticaseibacillus sharpeae]